MKILVKNLNFGQKFKFWSKIKILAKNDVFGQKSKFIKIMFQINLSALKYYETHRSKK